MREQHYPSDVTDQEWAILGPLLPAAKPGGRPRRVDMRQVVNAIFYRLKTGCQWRMLPKEFPHWKTVYHYFYHYFTVWRRAGVWSQVNTALREQVRRKAGRQATPSAGNG